jgi:hypothetical protein
MTKRYYSRVPDNELKLIKFAVTATREAVNQGSDDTSTLIGQVAAEHLTDRLRELEATLDYEKEVRAIVNPAQDSLLS